MSNPWKKLAESEDTIVFTWYTGSITVLKKSLLDESAAYLKKLLKTAEKNRTEVSEELQAFIQENIDALDSKNCFDKKKIEKYSKLLDVFADRKQTREEKALSNIVKNNTIREELQGVFYNAGKYCVMDSYCCIRTASRPYGIRDAKTAYDVNSKVFTNISGYTEELELPRAADIRKDVKIAKNSNISFDKYRVERTGRNTRVYYYFGYNKPMVNTEYLLTIIDALPDCKVYYNPVIGKKSFLYFVAGENDGILLPVKKEQEFENAPEELEHVQETRREEPRPETTATEENETESVETAETADNLQSPVMPRNLSQIKKAIAAGYAFKIIKHYIKPELSGQLRKANKIQTNGFYSIVPGEPENPVSLANSGRGYWLDYDAAKNWKFDGDIITRFSRNSVIFEITFNLSYKAQQETATEPEEPEQTEEERRAVIVSRLSAIAAAVSVSENDSNMLDGIIRQFRRGFITEEEAKKLLLFPVSAVNYYALALPEYREPDIIAEPEEQETAGDATAWYNPQQETAAEIIKSIAAGYQEPITGDAETVNNVSGNAAEIAAGKTAANAGSIAGSVAADPPCRVPGAVPVAVFVPAPVLRFLNDFSSCSARPDSSFCALSVADEQEYPRPP